MAAYVRGFCAFGKFTNCLPETEAKFITKSRRLELLPGRITSAEYKAGICTADDCLNVSPNCTKPFACWAFRVTLRILKTKLKLF